MITETAETVRIVNTATYVSRAHSKNVLYIRSTYLQNITSNASV